MGMLKKIHVVLDMLIVELYFRSIMWQLSLASLEGTEKFAEDVTETLDKGYL